MSFILRNFLKIRLTLKSIFLFYLLKNSLPKEAEVISLDLNRTKAAQNDPEHYKALKLILETFTIKYKDTTSYFQGLNFVSSFLLKTFNSPEIAFRMLCYLNEGIYKKIFNKQHPKYLPLIFYT